MKPEKERVPFSNEPYGPTPKRPVARLAIALVAAIGLIVWLRSPSDPKTTSLLLGSSSSASSPTSSPRPSSSSALLATDGGTIHDRHARDELRRKMIIAWSAAHIDEDKGRLSNSNAPLPPMPTGADGKIDPAYIRDVVRSDLRPMIEKCFEELRTRKPGAEGRFSMSFKIVGDAEIGGIVDETKLADDAGALAMDDSFTTCVRESTMTLAFRPPPMELGTRGEVVVPITLILREPQEKKP
jgi:hypothetical protein